MPFAVVLPAAPGWVVHRLRVAMSGFAALSCALALAYARESVLWWITAAWVLVCAWSLRRGTALLSGGRLAVDEGGCATWQAARGAIQPVRIARWSLCGPLAWLSLRFEESGRARDLLLWRPACDAGAWRRLRAWLVWYGRGRNEGRTAPTR